LTDQTEIKLPAILAGPIIRKASAEQLTLWMVSADAVSIHLCLTDKKNNRSIFDATLNQQQHSQIQVGRHAFVNLMTVKPAELIPLQNTLHYDLRLDYADGRSVSLTEAIPDLTYEGETLPCFQVHTQLSDVLHGSCRKPHHDSDDGLLVVDQQLKLAVTTKAEHPDLLIMSGDQVYTDDISGPTLVAIHQTIDTLGLFHEDINGAIVDDSKALIEHPFCYYQRPKLLPDDPSTAGLYSTFFAAKTKPIFTSVNANNHLVSFAEVMAMYILTWSPELWRLSDLTDENIGTEFKAKFATEKTIIEKFVEGLPKVRRALAHVPVYMIFDDHDVTDDWNLTRGWEEAIYNNPFAKRIVGNAILGYWLCQGWGNDPDRLAPLHDQARSHFTDQGIDNQDQLLDVLFDWEEWHYHLDTQPKIVVLDTRTQRWRSESSLSKPSGLMDWEALCELQQELIGQESVIMVSAAPIFGVKLIETIQRIFTFFGAALTVDAENWMAHKGTASVILNIFRNRKTPPNFVILSGDVHYSFVYDISLRFRRNSPKITQITCSGIKNQFPESLLRWFDTLNRLFYGKRSPLNWFTQRRNMVVMHRRPGDHKYNTLLNRSGIGLLSIDKSCKNVVAKQLSVTGETIEFTKKPSKH
jgi:hypothetical protein